MAWVAPSTRTTGTLITAAIWNQDSVENPTVLRAGGIAIASQAALDFIYALSASQLARLAKGSGGQAIRLNEAGSAYEFYTPGLAPRTIIATAFETAARFTSTVVAGGAVSYSNIGIDLNSSATISSSAHVEYAVLAQPTTGGVFTTYPGEFGVYVLLDTIGTDLQGFFGLGNITTGGAGITYTSAHIGFKVVRAASGTCSLFATQADGATETASSALTTVVAGDVIDLAVRVNSSSSVDYYWRKNGSAWSSATNLTTNIPSTATVRGASLAVSNAGVATATRFYIPGAYYSR